MPKILMVSKPMHPPWDDAAKNLARDIVLNCPDTRFHVMTAPPETFTAKNAKPAGIYSPQDGYGITLYDKIKLFFRLLQPDELGLYHFFFAPNPKTSKMCKLAMNMKGYQKSVQTICSQPASFENIEKLMFANEIVTVSKDCLNKFKEAGISNVRCIYPSVEEKEIPDADKISEIRKQFSLPVDKTLALFAGDLEFSSAAKTLVDALPEALKNENLAVVFCNRTKTPASHQKLKQIKKQVAKLDASDRVFFVPPSEDFLDLLSAVDFQLLHPDSLFGKMDIPLVILEGMALKTPAILSKLPSLEEICEDVEAAMYIEADNPAQLAEAMKSMAEDKAKRTAMATSGLKLVKERFSPQTMAEQYTKLYKEFD